METISTFSQKLDPYRAGIEIGEAVKASNPEVIFLFASIDYNGSPETAEAIYDVLGHGDVLLIGCTGDGFYEKDKVANVGISALAINSNGAISWQVEIEDGVGAKPYEASHNCLTRLAAKAPEARLFLLFSDFRTDATEVMRGINHATKTPVMGGMAGDNFAIESCFLYKDREVLTDVLITIALSGDFPFEILTFHNTSPDGKVGTLTRCSATTIHDIDQKPAMTFMEESLGMPLNHMDCGVITANVMDPADPKIMRHRSLLLSTNPGEDSDIKLFGGIAEGEQIQLCMTNSEQITAELQTAAEGLDQLDFQPEAAMIVSCVGRKQLLGNNNSIEIDALSQADNIPPAIAGFPSLGEISPVKTSSGCYSATLFHNMTYVMLVLGSN
ncbi:MAG: FIST N-terminal domain-containing protein [Thermodesulfobacteriota bacterium]